MAGAATATLSGGCANCTFQASGGFGMASQVPPQMQAPHGQFSFMAEHCSGTVTVTLDYPEPLPANVVFRKPDGAGGWFDPQDVATALGLTLYGSRQTVTYRITDNDLGDADSGTGTIADPLLPVVPLAWEAVRRPFPRWAAGGWHCCRRWQGCWGRGGCAGGTDGGGGCVLLRRRAAQPPFGRCHPEAGLEQPTETRLAGKSAAP